MGIGAVTAVWVTAAPGAAAGRLYGADLVGAAVGAPVTAIFLLPVLGVWGAMVGLATINIALVPCLLLLAALSRRCTAGAK